LTETVKNEIETLRPMTAWLKFGAFYKLVNEQIECFILFCFILQVNWSDRGKCDCYPFSRFSVDYWV